MVRRGSGGLSADTGDVLVEDGAVVDGSAASFVTVSSFENGTRSGLPSSSSATVAKCGCTYSLLPASAVAAA